MDGAFCIRHEMLGKFQIYPDLSAALRRRKGAEMVTVKINEKEWLDGVYEKICAKMLPTAERNRHKIPYTADNGVFDDQVKTNPCWWTNGFWGGILWQMYHATNSQSPM